MQTAQLFFYPTIVNGRTMLPLRFACEALKADVNWIAAEQAIGLFIHLKNNTPQISNS
ncbi:MAG: stalk domain-containing protein [Caldisericia bacterium]